MSTLTESVKTLDPDLILGYLSWYSIISVEEPYGDFLSALEDAGLNYRVPRPPSGVDTFRRVCSAAERRKVPTEDDLVELQMNFMIRSIDETADPILRRIVCELVNKKGEKLDYTELCDIKFNRGTSSISRRVINDNKIADEIYSEIQTEFSRWNNKLTSQLTREWIRKFLIHEGAILVRETGGVYFIPKEQASKLEALEEFVDGLTGTSVFHSHPLVDSEKQRTMVKKALEAETIGEIESIVAEIQGIKRVGVVADKQLQKALARYIELNDRSSIYKTLLEDECDRIDTHLYILKNHIQSIQNLHERQI